MSGEGRIYHPYLAGWRDDVSYLCEVALVRGPGVDPNMQTMQVFQIVIAMLTSDARGPI